MIKEKLKRGSFFYKLYLYFNIFIRYKFFYRSRKSFSQFGEDLFINEFFKDKLNGKYVDLGAFHPMRLNNTYLLHKKGWSGTNVDLNPISIDLFKIARKKDVNICCLISNETDVQKDVYIHHDWSADNTVVLDNNSEDKTNEKRRMNCRNFESLITHKFDFLNIDLEGHDYEVLKTINLKKYNPKLICVEILENSKDYHNTFKYMKNNNYEFVKRCGVSYFFKYK